MFAEKFVCGILIFISIVDQPGARLEACNIADWASCNRLEKFEDGFFLGFTKLPSLNDTCRVMDMALDCALKPQTISGCQEERQRNMIAVYRGHKLVLTAICNTYRYAFEKSQQCFMESGLEDGMTLEECEEEAEEEGFDDECERNDLVFECIKNTITDAMESCEAEDVSLMIYLYQQYLSPLNKAYECDGPPAETSNIRTTPMATQPTTTTTTEPSTRSIEDETTSFREFKAETTPSSMNTFEAEVGRSQNSASRFFGNVDHIMLLVGILFAFLG